MKARAETVCVELLLLLVVAGCSPHKARILTARQNGNEPLAACYDGCDQADRECISRCERQFPARWHHRYHAAARPFVVAGKRIEGSIAMSLHPLAVRDARAHGNEPLARCYAQCSPSDASCLKGCDRRLATQEDHARRRRMYLLAAEIGLAAYQKQRAERRTRPPVTSSTTADSASPAVDRPGGSPPTDTSSSTSSFSGAASADGACRCQGWPLGTDPDTASQPRAEHCESMRSGGASACDSSCKAQGYAIGLLRSPDSCD